MPMHATTVRFSPALWRRLELEAASDGVSAAQFVRDAALLRIGALAGVRGEDTGDDAIDALAGLVRRGREATLPSALSDARRLAAVRGTGLLDAEGGAPFARLTALACRILDAPRSAVTLLEADRLVVVAMHTPDGPATDIPAVPAEDAFCPHLLDEAGPLVICDSRRDTRVCGSPAIDEYGVMAYLGVPLRDEDDQILGALCVTDERPRAWGDDQVELLAGLAASVMSEIALRAARRPGR